MKELINFYSDYSEDKRLFEKRSRSLERITTIEYIKKYINSTSTVADIGAGPGVYAIDIAKTVKSIIAVDIVPKHTEEINEKCRQNSISNIECITASATNLKAISDEKADLVLCLGPLYHIKNRKERFEAIKECKCIHR
ncbi:class I SAM-dependent methyltransferase, partial [Spirochaeta dissipatitropha]